VAKPEGLHPPRPAEHRCDVLVVGGGPSGSAAAYWLADRGVDVLCIEKKHFPREKTCGDGLTPRSVRQLQDMGLESALAGRHRHTGLRSVAFGREFEMSWPAHPDYPSYGYTVTRFDLDGLVCEQAEKAGATVWQGAEAVAPLETRPADGSADGTADGTAGGTADGPAGATGTTTRRAGGAIVVDKDRGTRTEVHAKYVIVADGSLSRFGRALGASRNKSYPQGMAIRGYFRSPRHDDAFIESHLDIRDREGNVVPGYGWIFPLGDGRVNVGIGLLSTTERWKGLNTTKLLEQFVDFAPKSWCISPSTACSVPTGGRLPMGLAVGPRVGGDFVMTGDAIGAINPFNGEGIAYGYETGRFAADTIANVLERPDRYTLEAYEQRLQSEYGRYYAVARGFVKVIGNPTLMRGMVGAGMYSKPLMSTVLRVMANLCRPDELGPAELLYKGAAGVSKKLEVRRSLRG